MGVSTLTNVLDVGMQHYIYHPMVYYTRWEGTYTCQVQNIL